MTNPPHRPILILSPDGTGVRSVLACSCGQGLRKGAAGASTMGSWYRRHAHTVGASQDVSAAVYGPGYAAAGMTWHEWIAENPGRDPFTGAETGRRRP